MTKLNHHYQKLPQTYLFTEIEKKVAAFQAKKPHSNLTSLGVGDITMPLPSSVIAELMKASEEMGQKDAFRGYGPSQGYLFLRELIAQNDYPHLGISPEEIFISDGANTDLANIQELFSADTRVALPDPAYPVYLDATIMAGRTRLPLKQGGYGGVTTLPCVEENDFQILPPLTVTDLVYLCSPHNPTGVALTRSTFKKWIDYAHKHKAILIVDAAYEAYITDPTLPKSIYELSGAKEVAIEVKSFSKNAGFTGLRCSYTVIPHELKIVDMGSVFSLNALWKRRQDAKTNGVSYPVQRAAAATYSSFGKTQVRALVKEYLQRAQLLLEGLTSLGWTVFGGVNAPYVWAKVPPKMSSWEFFDFLLEKAEIVTLPGSGFGKHGEGYVRLASFASKEVIAKALQKLQAI